MKKLNPYYNTRTLSEEAMEFTAYGRSFALRLLRKEKNVLTYLLYFNGNRTDYLIKVREIGNRRTIRLLCPDSTVKRTKTPKRNKPPTYGQVCRRIFVGLLKHEFQVFRPL